MDKKELKAKFDEKKQQIIEGTSPQQQKFRRKKKSVLEEEAYKDTLFSMFDGSIPTKDIIDGIQNKIFDTEEQHFGDDVSVIARMVRISPDKNILPQSFSAIRNILSDAAKNLNKGEKDNTIREIDNTQFMLYDLSAIREQNPQLSKQTDEIYKSFTNLMQAYSVSPHYDDSKHSNITKDYFYKRDDYVQTIEAEDYFKQTDMAWDSEQRLEDAKKRIYGKISQKEIAAYEQQHAEQVIKEDQQDKADRDKVLAEHQDHILTQEHRKQVNEISLYRTEERVINAYDNFKNVARKVEENSGEPADNTDKGIKTSPVPKRAVFIGRINPKESFMK